MDSFACGDLDRHIDEEIAAAGLAVVTEEDARRILARIGPLDSEPSAQPRRPTLTDVRRRILTPQVQSASLRRRLPFLNSRYSNLERKTFSSTRFVLFV